jgi:hypothetical protein
MIGGLSVGKDNTSTARTTFSSPGSVASAHLPAPGQDQSIKPGGRGSPANSDFLWLHSVPLRGSALSEDRRSAAGEMSNPSKDYQQN